MIALLAGLNRGKGLLVEVGLCSALLGITSDGLAQASAVPQARPFSFLSNLTSSLSFSPVIVGGGRVRINGIDSRLPSIPFTFAWGDGTTSESFFVAEHTYHETSREYTLTVTAHYGSEDASRSTVIRFTRPDYAFVRDRGVPERIRISPVPVQLASTMPGYGPPTDLLGFADGDLAIPRATLQYVLDIGHHLQSDFCNGDIDTNGGLGQVVLNQPKFGGAFSLWYAKPVAMVANPSYLSKPDGISSLYHEMGHNLTLNSPARYRFGGKVDGPMNTIVSETLAQIMQHATAWELLNRPGQFGLSRSLTEAIRDSALNSFSVTSDAYRRYVAEGCPFTTRQIQGEEQDRTLGTFMVLAYVFVEEMESKGTCRDPLKRMMRLLQTFHASDHARYRRPEEDAFRATFMVAALSHGFDRDLRPKFRALKFPIDEPVYAEMMGRMKAARPL